MLNSQRSLSELPKMSAASQVERVVLVSYVFVFKYYDAVGLAIYWQRHWLISDALNYAL